MDSVAKGVTPLEEKLSRLKELQPGSEEEKNMIETINKDCTEIGRTLLNEMATTSSGMTKELLQEDDKVFSNRLLAALGGGLALIVPMLIMSWPRSPKRRL